MGRDASGRARLVPAVQLQRDYVPATEAGLTPGPTQLVTASRMFPARTARFGTFPDVIDERVRRPDGSLDRACRRSFPTPQVSFYRMVGLSRLLPNSPRFNASCFLC